MAAFLYMVTGAILSAILAVVVHAAGWDERMKEKWERRGTGRSTGSEVLSGLLSVPLALLFLVTGIGAVCGAAWGLDAMWHLLEQGHAPLGLRILVGAVAAAPMIWAVASGDTDWFSKLASLPILVLYLLLPLAMYGARIGVDLAWYLESFDDAPPIATALITMAATSTIALAIVQRTRRHKGPQLPRGRSAADQQTRD